MEQEIDIVKHGKVWAEKNIGTQDCPECGKSSKFVHAEERGTAEGKINFSMFKCISCGCMFRITTKK